MGFYIRKSVSVGPLRFNLSNGGVGISAGVRGLRVGTGPRGNYVHMGRHGLYYRQTFAPARTPAAPPLPIPNLQPILHADTHEPLQNIESADAGAIRDSSSESILTELCEKRRKIALMPITVIGGILLLLTSLGNGWPGWLCLLVIVATLVAAIAMRRRDKLVKTVVIMYELDQLVESAFRLFCDWATSVAASHRVWHVDAAGRVYDRKYHAGANQLIQRSPAVIREESPPYVTTNVPVYAIKAGGKSLFLFPDRVLIYNGVSIGAVSYSSLDIQASATRFIEDGPVPADSQVVDHTWKYVNRNGGPDQRFNNNRQLPICQYDELWLKTSSGLNEILQLSRSGIGKGFAEAVRHLAAVAPQSSDS